MGFKVDEDSERGGAGGDYSGEVIILIKYYFHERGEIIFEGGDKLRVGYYSRKYFTSIQAYICNHLSIVTTSSKGWFSLATESESES